LASDTTAPESGAPRRGPRSTTSRDWLFGYAPRRHLLTGLFGPDVPADKLAEQGLSAAQLAALGGKCRSGARADIAALEELGLIKRCRVGRRDRYFPVFDCALARSICLLIEGVEAAAPPAQ
jgi:hypothetical protein